MTKLLYSVFQPMIQRSGSLEMKCLSEKDASSSPWPVPIEEPQALLSFREAYEDSSFTFDSFVCWIARSNNNKNTVCKPVIQPNPGRISPLYRIAQRRGKQSSSNLEPTSPGCSRARNVCDLSEEFL